MTREEFIAFIRKNPIGVACGAVSLALAGGIYFRSSSIPEAQDELEKKSAEADRYAANIKNSAQLKEQLDALVAANREVETRLIKGSQLALNYQIFYQLFAETGVKQIDLRPGAVPKPGKGAYLAIPFSVSVQGDEAQLLKFLRTLEGGAHYCRVLSANLNVNTAARSSPLTLALNLELLGLP